MGVHPDRIIYAHTVKSTSHVKFAEEHGVTLMTFDCIEELHKVKDKKARFQLVSIHENPEIFSRAIERARIVFDIAADIGKPMSVLDLGGGFPGALRGDHKFMQTCECIRRSIDEHFPESSGVQIIAEPGQFFCTSAYFLVLRVVGKRRNDVVIDGVSHRHQDVFLNESKNNCISQIFDFCEVKIMPLEEPRERPMEVLTTLWGGTCYPLDRIDDMKLFFDVNVDEWLVMDNMGAYTLSFVCGFNGTGFPTVHYIAPPSSVNLVHQTVERSPIRSGYLQPQEALKMKRLRDKAELVKGNYCTVM
ncbi:ornithine decarboxylase-like [Dermacentor andersoni]|uniref:ornithine decarboxylase-like n=1 Tax=Dermacentor andersoni TaxID=34620 RepID=UPI003B39FC62